MPQHLCSEESSMNNPKASEADIQPWGYLDRLIVLISHLLSGLFIVVVAISFYEIVMRYFFNAPTMWVHETASFLGASLFVLGGSYALAVNKHVRVVLIYDLVSPKVRLMLDVVHHVAGLILMLLLSYAAYGMMLDSWFAPWGDMRLETSGSAWNPAYPALLKGIILVCLGLMVVQFVTYLVRDVWRLVRGQADV